MNPFGTTVLLPPDFMVGAIIIWSGLLASIPSNWQLCDGTNGTPNLTARMVFGELNDPQHRVTGGFANHTHEFTGDGHNHQLTQISDLLVESGNAWDAITSDEPASGTTGAADNFPPFMRLYYIQRMS